MGKGRRKLHAPVLLFLLISVLVLTVEAALAYMTAATGAVSPATPSPAPSAARGNPVVGKELFTGRIRLQHAGPGCIACHAIGGIGALGGGQVGPDLTDEGLVAAASPEAAAALDRFLASVGTNPSRPTMRAVWGSRPLTPAERADIIAFLREAAMASRPTGVITRLALLAATGAVILFALIHLWWRRRLGEVRRPMVAGVAFLDGRWVTKRR